MSNETKPKTKTEEIQARRNARKEELDKVEDVQAAIDLEAIDALEVEHGDNNIAVIVVPFTPGSVTRVAARTPKPEEIKRYRFRTKPKKLGDMPNTIEAAAELCAVCRVYPNDEQWARVLSERPGLDTQLGQMAVKLAVGSEEEEGKG